MTPPPTPPPSPRPGAPVTANRKAGVAPPPHPSLVTYPADGSDAAGLRRLIGFVKFEALVLAILSGVLLFVMPFAQPLYRYYAMNPKQEIMQLTQLLIPNMTSRAILSWATTSVTEIMTIGFGDYEQKLMNQKPRFTPEGWSSFSDAFIRQKIGESFKKNQLVLTTVPSNTPVIVAEGVNPQHVYQWRVQMPVIMTYATNNNVTQRERAVIDLIIVRVPASQNAAGIGIAGWSIKS